MFIIFLQETKTSIDQGSPNLFLQGQCPAEFSSNPNQTHLKQLIKVLLGILETSRQVCWGKLELNSAGVLSRIKFDDPWYRLRKLFFWVSNIDIRLETKEYLLIFYNKVSFINIS